MENNKNTKEIKFPQDFLWGASTSAYQIEGGIKNDWSEWEKDNAQRLAGEAKYNWAEWQQKKFPEMFTPDNYICGQAVNSYNMTDEDIECIKKLNLKAYRFGIEWARIEPEKGKIDKKELEHYRIFIKKLKDNNIEPIVTIWHWTNPVWISSNGGWHNPKTVQYFLNYVDLIVKEFGDMVKYWVSLNEPMMHIGHGYVDAKFPPNYKFNLIKILRAFKNLTKAHRESYKIIHKHNHEAKVSIAMTTGYFDSASGWNPIELLLVKIAHYFRNDWFLKKLKGHLDYIGVNYYHHDRIIWHPPFKRNLNEKINDRGWEIFPVGIYHVLKSYKKYKKPIIILENGTADSEDEHREDFIKDHLFYIHKAINEGVDVFGYCHWSLLDNFEWAEGFWPKFGLYEVDRENNFTRKARSSALAYAKICKENKIKF